MGICSKTANGSTTSTTQTKSGTPENANMFANGAVSDPIGKRKFYHHIIPCVAVVTFGGFGWGGGEQLHDDASLLSADATLLNVNLISHINDSTLLKVNFIQHG